MTVGLWLKSGQHRFTASTYGDHLGKPATASPNRPGAHSTAVSSAASWLKFDSDPQVDRSWYDCVERVQLPRQIRRQDLGQSKEQVITSPCIELQLIWPGIVRLCEKEQLIVCDFFVDG